MLTVKKAWRTAILAISLFLLGCNGDSSQSGPEASPATRPATSLETSPPIKNENDPTSINQYIGTWQTYCAPETIFLENPVTPLPIYTILTLSIALNRVEIIERRFSDNLCEQQIDNRYSWYKGYVISDIDIQESFDVAGNIIIGELSGTVLKEFQNHNGGGWQGTNPGTLSLLLHRGDEYLFSGGYSYRSSMNEVILNFNNEFIYIGEPVLILP